MVSNAEFQEYKESFLAANKIPRGWVLMRRVRDNQLTICKKDAAGHYEGHIIEPIPAKEETQGQPTTEKQKPGRKSKEVPVEGEANPNSEEV